MASLYACNAVSGRRARARRKGLIASQKPADRHAVPLFTSRAAKRHHGFEEREGQWEASCGSLGDASQPAHAATLFALVQRNGPRNTTIEISN
jgi:hypothetical protein